MSIALEISHQSEDLIKIWHPPKLLEKYICSTNITLKSTYQKGPQTG